MKKRTIALCLLLAVSMVTPAFSTEYQDVALEEIAVENDEAKKQDVAAEQSEKSQTEEAAKQDEALQVEEVAKQEDEPLTGEMEAAEPDKAESAENADVEDAGDLLILPMEDATSLPSQEEELSVEGATTSGRKATVTHAVTDKITASSSFNCNWTYSAQTPTVVNFWDDQNRYNVASYASTKLTINRYDENFNWKDAIVLSNPYSLFGTVTCDQAGNYYVVWGQQDSSNANSVVTSLVKYSYAGVELGRCEIKGYDSNPYMEWGEPGSKWGTMLPFRAGNCELAINGDVISCNYARQMYSTHQSNYIFYVNRNTMERLYPTKNVPYCSHSFDQDVIPTSDGGFLYANHGDASKRGFVVSKVKNGVQSPDVITFHFREGGARDHGYNETFAQLGGLCETENTYVLCGSSEKTLSLAYALTNGVYCGHSEARNLFVQILKKDFASYSGANMYYTQGQIRKAVGTKPVQTEAEAASQPLRLKGTEVDYGVIWLTNLDDNHYVCNPKVISLGGGQIAVLWEELDYVNNLGQAYYEVINESGAVIIDRTEITGTYLMGNTDLTYHNGLVYWATKDSNGQKLHKMDLKQSTVVPQGPTPTPTQKPTGNDSGDDKDTGNGKTDKEKTPVVGKVVGDEAATGFYKIVSIDKKQVAFDAPTKKELKSVKVPDVVTLYGEKYKVTKISNNAFKGNKNVTKVTIGNNVTTIGANAFSGARNLTTVTIGKNVSKIGKNAFYGCKKIKTMTIKTKKLTLKKVSTNAFKGIQRTATVKIPRSKKKAYKSLLTKRGMHSKAIIRVF